MVAHAHGTLEWDYCRWRLQNRTFSWDWIAAGARYALPSWPCVKASYRDDSDDRCSDVHQRIPRCSTRHHSSETFCHTTSSYRNWQFL